ncbi:MAG: gliding motility-associated ABC transporter substrate-binding protein GldG [Bacteroidota bacterium]
MSLRANEMTKQKKRNIKRNNLLQISLGVVIIVLINIIASFVFTRIDLTAEKRYSLSPAVKTMLKGLQDDVFFRVYLDGELPSGFRRLSNETRDMLNEFRAYSDHIHFEFIDPSASPLARERNDTYRLLVEQGLQPTDLRVTNKGESSQLIIFPGAIVVYRGRELPVQILMTQLGQDPQKVLNNSIQALEYNLGNAVDKLINTTKPRVAILEGHGELSRGQTIDLEGALSEYYNVERIAINSKINSLTVRLQTDSSGSPLVNTFKALIIAGPERSFNEKDKFLIDQFIMRGGRILWMIDPVFAKMDSLQQYASTMGLANDINLDDMLFNYGVRLNKNLVMDMSALPIPVKTGQIGDQPQFDFFPWYYFPLITPSSNHPVVNGLNAIKTEFISSLDTVEASGVRKTVLLTSSRYSRIVNAPVLIDLEILRHEPDQRMYSSGPQPVALLLEGEFTSAYLFRLPPEIEQNEDLGFRKKSRPTRMVVIADGDIAKNQYHITQKYPLPLGYDQYTGQTFGNKELLMNIMNYLCDDSGLISIRSRELKLRLLDMTRLTSERPLWQTLNVVVPILLIVGFGLVKYQVRRRKYAKRSG